MAYRIAINGYGRIGQCVLRALTERQTKATGEAPGDAAPLLEVVAINDSLEDAPETVNSDPYGAGWFFRLQPSDEGELGELMSAESYEQHCAEDH